MATKSTTAAVSEQHEATVAEPTAQQVVNEGIMRVIEAHDIDVQKNRYKAMRAIAFQAFIESIEAEAEIAHLVAERVLARPQPPMDDRGVDDRMRRFGAHGLSAAVRAATGTGSGGIAGRSATTRGGSPIRRCSSGRGQGRWTPNCSATSRPADKASSWKP